MRLFYYKPKPFYPLIFAICKLETQEETDKVELLSHDIFELLIEYGKATEDNILVFSIIKDYNKKTENMILPSTKSNKQLLERCYSNIKFLNAVIVKTLKNNDTEFYLEFTDTKILIHSIKINLMSLANYYRIN
jgi:hypothetical protein